MYCKSWQISHNNGLRVIANGSLCENVSWTDKQRITNDHFQIRNQIFSIILRNHTWIDLNFELIISRYRDEVSLSIVDWNLFL
jgi:hypothetical protein